jgi:hypothetical protein
MNINELCDRVNAQLELEGIAVGDARTSGSLTPRNVRYYKTMGLIDPPQRLNGRASYGTHHLEQIVKLKRAQADGVRLEDIRGREEIQTPLAVSVPIFEPVAVDQARGLASRTSHRAPAWDALHVHALSINTHENAVTQPMQVGWSVRVGDITLSGVGNRPSSEQLLKAARALSEDESE